MRCIKWNIEERGEKRGEERGEIVGQIKILVTMRQNNLITQLQYEQMIQPLKSQLKEMIENESKMRKKRYYWTSLKLAWE